MVARSFAPPLMVLMAAAAPWAGGDAAPDGAPRAQVTGPSATCPSSAAAEVTNALRNRLEAAVATGHLAAASERIMARNALPEFYARRGYEPAWLIDGVPTPCALGLVARLGAVEDEGLDGADYHRDAIAATLRATRGGREASALVDLELLLTDAYLVLGSHLLQGRVNPATLEPEWLANRRAVDMAAHLEETLASGSVDERLAALAPRQPGYGRLRARLRDLRGVVAAGGWGTVPEGPTLRPGERDPRVASLRARLVAGGDLADARSPDPELYDEELATAVRAFQARHGLDVDGAVGQGTLAALNVSAADRVRQVVVNMERWRWLPDDLGRRHIRVNIADYRVEVWDEGRVALAMRAVVGRQYRQTPVFSATMSYLVLAPYWHVPPTIASLDKLPEIKRDVGYLAAQRMTLLDAGSNQPVDPTTVDWASMTGAELNRRYRIRQDPGPINALGNVKFMFPNRHNVYLHDTPSRELFSRTARAFSSGCIRIERPLELADYLLREDPSWTPERIRATVQQGQETTVRLARGVPVHILYWTTFVDDDNVVHHRADIYGRDAAVLHALQGDPPGP